MRKLEIDYDFIDKIYESEGKYKIKDLWWKINLVWL